MTSTRRNLLFHNDKIVSVASFTALGQKNEVRTSVESCTGNFVTFLVKAAFLRRKEQFNPAIQCSELGKLEFQIVLSQDTFFE